MAITNTSNLDLEKPGYLHDGEEMVAALNDNADKIDALFASGIVTYEGEIVTYDGNIVIAVL